MSMAGSYCAFVRPPDDPRVAGLSELDAYGHAERCLQIPWLNEVFNGWQKLYAAPFFGITSDGSKIPSLYSFACEGAPVSSMIQSARIC